MTRIRIWSLVTNLRATLAGKDIKSTILDAANRLFARYGYRKTTVEDIAREAGIGKGTVYLHFVSKEEVALSAIDRVNTSLQERLRRIAQEPASPAGRLREMLILRVLFRFDAAQSISLSVYEIVHDLRERLIERRTSYFDAEATIFAGVLAEGKTAGEIDFTDPVETAHTLILATNSLLPQGLSHSDIADRGDVEDKARRVAEMLLMGILSRDVASCASDVSQPFQPHRH